jgi:hypothetical protein
VINLISTSDKIQLTPSSTSELEVRTDWVEATTVAGVIQADTFKPDNQRTGFTTAAVADIVVAPAANRVRNVKLIVVRNTGNTNPAANTVKAEVVNAAGNVDLFNVTLALGEWLTWNESGVLFVYATDGSVKASAGPGRYLRTNRLTSGVSYVTGADCSKIKVTVVGGGGAGGGCTSVASAAAAAGGGGAGAKAEKVFDVSPSTAYAYTIGAAGAGASGAAGGNGGASTFTGPGAAVVSAPGGTGGPVATAATTLTSRAGGDGGGLATGGDHNKGGNPGESGYVLIVATPILGSGNGGSGVYGDGGLGLVAPGNGNNATGNGAGGGGSATGASPVRTGGNGSGGIIVVEEYA